MKNLYLPIFTVLFMLTHIGSTSATTYIFKPTQSSGNYNWTNSNNWKEGNYPGTTVSPGDIVVIINSNWPCYINVDVTIGGTLNIDNSANHLNVLQGRTLTIGSGGTLIQSGNASVAGTLDNQGTILIYGYGKLTINSGGTLNQWGAIAKHNTGQLTINGTFNNNGFLYGYGPGTINGTSNLVNPANGTISPGYYHSNSGLNDPGCLSLDIDFTNEGTLDIQLENSNACSGFDQIEVTGDATVNGTIDVNFIDDIRPLTSTFTILTATGTLSANPIINFPAGYSGSYSVCNSCSPKELNITIDPVYFSFFSASPGQWSNTNKWTPFYPSRNISDVDEAIILSVCSINEDVNISGTLNNNAVLILENSKSLAINSSGIFNNDGTATIKGTLTNTGTITVNSGMQILIDGVFNNYGPVDINAPLINNGQTNVVAGSTITILSNGSFTHSGVGANISGTLFNKEGEVTVDANKVLTIESSGKFLQKTNLATINGTLLNEGTVQVSNNGYLTVNGTFTNNGILNGKGILNGTFNFTNPPGGIVAPGPNAIGPGCMSFDTDFTNLGTLEIDLGDGSVCTNFDRIDVTGNAVINGTIDISFIDDLEPNNNTFTILTATGVLNANPDNIIWPTGYSGSLSICQNCTPQELQVTFLSPLPVELIDFRAALQTDNTVTLDWQTASEQNNYGFEIQRSFNSQDWEVIGFVEGRGTTTQFVSYNLNDGTPMDGFNYYRLKQIDFDGAFEYSDIRVVEVKSTSPDISVSPNPVTDNLHIDLSPLSGSFSQNAKGSIQLFSSLGKSVLTTAISENDPSAILHLKDFPKGIYSLLIRIDQDVFTEQIIIQ